MALERRPSEPLHFTRSTNITYHLGPFTIRLQTREPLLLRLFGEFYGATDLLPHDTIAHFHPRLHRPTNLRHWLRPQILFSIDGVTPFEPFPLEQAFPLMEWGLNWCIAMRAHQYLLLHSAALERNGRVLLLPALPGSGKSTLCTALAHRGWRLLSDEFGLVRPETGHVWPLPKAIPLKNASIEVIRREVPEAYLGPLFPKTRKGDVVHVRPPTDSLRRQRESALPAWVTFPRFRQGVATRFTRIPRSQAFARLAYNSFNYHLLGETGFRSLVSLIRRCDCYELEYSSLSEAQKVLDGLTEDRDPNRA
jgi:HprK-related kinase A